MKKIVLVLVMLIGFFNVAVSQSENIEIIRKRNKDKSVSFSYKKHKPGSFYLEINFTSSENTNARDYKGTITGKSGFLFTLRPSNEKKNIKYNYKRRYTRGVYEPKVDSNFVYVLPFKEGKRVKVRNNKNLSERYLGKDKPNNWKSFNIKMSTPDVVVSIRRGLVVSVVDKFENDGLSKKYSSKTNRIIVEHKDGTYASYKGFKKGSIIVKEGDEIGVHQKLGILEAFNDFYRLDFQVYFLDLKQNKDADKNGKRKHTFINPFFRTDKGTVKLVHKEEYKVVFDQSDFTREFTKRELKRYKKNKGNLKK